MLAKGLQRHGRRAQPIAVHRADAAAQLQAVLHAIPAGVIAVDEAGVVTQCNPEAVRLLNLSGEKRRQKLMESTRTHACARWRRTRCGECAQSDEWTGERVLAVWVRPSAPAAERSVGAALVISDRTQLRNWSRCARSSCPTQRMS